MNSTDDINNISVYRFVCRITHAKETYKKAYKRDIQKTIQSTKSIESYLDFVKIATQPTERALFGSCSNFPKFSSTVV